MQPAEDAISDLTLFVEGTGITSLQALADDQQLATILGNANTISRPLVAIHQLLNGPSPKKRCRYKHRHIEPRLSPLIELGPTTAPTNLKKL